MPQLAINGIAIHLQTLGAGDPVIMIHGLLVGNMASWYFGPAATLAKDHQVVVYDLRGHGLSEQATEGYTLDAMVRDLESIVRAQNFTSVSLVGHSYGGLIALHFALRNPDIVKKLVIVEAPLPPGRVAEMDTFFEKSPSEILAALPDGLRATMAGQARQAKKFVERIDFLVSKTDLLQNLRSEADIASEVLQSLKLPVLLIYGESSQLREVGERLLRELGHAELEWLPGGHYLTAEQPAALSQKIGRFLQ